MADEGIELIISSYFDMVGETKEQQQKIVKKIIELNRTWIIMEVKKEVKSQLAVKDYIWQKIGTDPKEET